MSSRIRFGVPEIAGYLTVFIPFFACIAAWATHVIVCIKAGTWLLLLAGAIAFPIGIVHGFGVWFGLWS